MNFLTSPEFLFSTGVVILLGVGLYWQRHKSKGGTASEVASSRQGLQLLDQYAIDYTAKARNGELQPVIGRQREIEHLIQVLSRKTKNNALLLGKPGVGKTAVVERLAQLVVAGQVPETIRNKAVVELDLASLVSGTKYRGELEKRLDAIRKALRAQEHHIILFIDEIQQLAQASGAEGGLNPGDILKPELARGHLQLIGATTYDDFEKYILPEESLERRFQPIHVHEPSREETIDMLNGVRAVFEKYHAVKYADDSIAAIVDFSKKYIHERYLPDKAIDVLDEAGVRVHIRALKDKITQPVQVTVDDVRQVVAEWVEKSKEEVQ